jgi:CBS domain containing-hemolysin-like protein
MLEAVMILALIAAAALRAGAFSVLRIARADALRDAAEGRSGAAVVARLLEQRENISPAVNAVHSALLLIAAVPAAWLASRRPGGGAAVAWSILALVVGLWLTADYIPRALGRWRPRVVAYRLAHLVRVAVRWGAAANDLLVDEEEIPSNGEEVDEEEEQEERELISSVLDFTDTIVREVMVPRTDMVTIDRSSGIAGLAALAEEHGYSRFPLTDGPDGEIVGTVLAKDVLGAYAAGRPFETIDEFRRDVVFIPETKKVSDLLREMQVSKTHLGIVVDEFGDITGLVTIEDLLEELVGEIVDEHDEVEQMIVRNDDGSYLVDARLDVSELAETVGVSLPDEEWDTVAGLVLGLAGRVPEEGEQFEINGLRVRVLRLQGRRVAEVEVRRLPASVSRESTH